MVTLRRDLAMRGRRIEDGEALCDAARLLIFAPHPDDEVLGCGGLIAQAKQRGLAVRVVFFTNGDGSGSTRLGEIVRRQKRPTYAEIAALRQNEATSALKKLGVTPDEIVFLGYPDGGLLNMWRDHWKSQKTFRSPFTRTDAVSSPNALSPNAPYMAQSVLRDLLHLLEEFRPTVVFTTDGNDTHSDHRAAFCFLRAALETFSLAPNREKIAFWTYLIHHAIWPVPHGLHAADVLAPPHSLSNIGANWRAWPLSSLSRHAKRAALEEYRSQMTWTPHYLRAFLRCNELFNVQHENADVESTSSTRYEILRDPTADSTTRTFCGALDIEQLQVGLSETEMRFEIVLRGALSPRAVYALQLHGLSEKIERNDNWEIAARFAQNRWSATFQDTTSALEVGENNLVFVVPRALLPPAIQTVLVAASAARRGKTIDETSVLTVRLRDVTQSENEASSP